MRVLRDVSTVSFDFVTFIRSLRSSVQITQTGYSFTLPKTHPNTTSSIMVKIPNKKSHNDTKPKHRQIGVKMDEWERFGVVKSDNQRRPWKPVKSMAANRLSS